MIFLFLQYLILPFSVLSSDSTRTKLVLNGASGDLARKYLLPALYDLYSADPTNIHVTLSDKDFDHGDANLRGRVSELVNSSVQVSDNKDASEFVSSLQLVRLFQSEEYLKFCEQLPDKKLLFYLAIPSSSFLAALEYIHVHCTSPERHVTVALEKPVGSCLAEFRRIRETVDHISTANFRVVFVDHYAAKDTVAGLAKSLGWLSVEDVRRIDVALLDPLDVSAHLATYSQTGVVRDVMQSHATEILARIFAAALDKQLSLLSYIDAREKLLAKLMSSKLVWTASYSGFADQLESAGLEPAFVPTAARAEIVTDPGSTLGKLRVFITAMKASAKKLTFVRISMTDQTDIFVNLEPPTNDFPGFVVASFNDSMTKVNTAIPCSLKSHKTPYPPLFHRYSRFAACNFTSELANAYVKVFKHLLGGEPDLVLPTTSSVGSSWELWQPTVDAADSASHLRYAKYSPAMLVNHFQPDNAPQLPPLHPYQPQSKPPPREVPTHEASPIVDDGSQTESGGELQGNENLRDEL